MKRIGSILKTDFRLMIRDRIVLYMALGPVLLAFVLVAVMGGVGKTVMTYAAVPGVPQDVLQNLDRMADVRVYGSYEQMKARVERADSAAGVYMKDGKPALLLEGNEAEEFKANASLLLARAIAGDIPAFENRAVQAVGNVATTIALTMLLLLCVFLGGTVAGFNMVSERESGVIRALSVSPLTQNGYLLARAALALLLSLANVALCTTILGKGGRLIPLLPAALFSAPVCSLIALVLAGTASNQIAAIGTIKLLMPACMIVPISSVFVPAGLKFLYWWIPVYWQYEAFAQGLAGKIDLAACTLLLLTGIAWLIVLSKLTARKLGLRYNKRRYRTWRGTGGF